MLHVTFAKWPLPFHPPCAHFLSFLSWSLSPVYWIIFLPGVAFLSVFTVILSKKWIKVFLKIHVGPGLLKTQDEDKEFRLMASPMCRSSLMKNRKHLTIGISNPFISISKEMFGRNAIIGNMHSETLLTFTKCPWDGLRELVQLYVLVLGQ